MYYKCGETRGSSKGKGLTPHVFQSVVLDSTNILFRKVQYLAVELRFPD